MGDAVFRADLIEELGSKLGFEAATEAARIMLGEANEAQIDEVRNLLPKELQPILPEATGSLEESEMLESE